MKIKRVDTLTYRMDANRLPQDMTEEYWQGFREHTGYAFLCLLEQISQAAPVYFRRIQKKETETAILYTADVYEKKKDGGGKHGKTPKEKSTDVSFVGDRSSIESPSR